MERTPIYGIKDFTRAEGTFYANRLSAHVSNHIFTRLPHKHDFYLTMLVTEGSGWHEIDFKKYPVKRGSVFLMQPGQVHYWDLSKEIEGYIFFHSRSFYDEAYTLGNVQSFPFFNSFQSRPYVLLGKDQMSDVERSMREILKESGRSRNYKLQKLHSWISIVYIDIARVYPAVKTGNNRRYFEKFNQFRRILELNFHQNKLPKFYAAELGLSEKHLNRIVQSCVNETSTSFIAERVVLEAKRLLMRADLNVNEISDELGFSDPSYFVRFFKKHVDETPLGFLKRYTNKKSAPL